MKVLWSNISCFVDGKSQKDGNNTVFESVTDVRSKRAYSIHVGSEPFGSGLKNFLIFFFLNIGMCHTVRDKIIGPASFCAFRCGS